MSDMSVPARSGYNDQNIFAKILRGEIPNTTVYEDAFALAFHDINPQAPLHVLVIPKGPYVSFADFSDNAPDDMVVGFIRAVGKVARDLGLDDPGYRLLANAGHDAHQEVPHFHVHIFAGKNLGPMIDRRFAGVE